MYLAEVCPTCFNSFCRIVPLLMLYSFYSCRITTRFWTKPTLLEIRIISLYPSEGFKDFSFLVRHIFYSKGVIAQKSSAVGLCKYTILGTIQARAFLYLHKLFLLGAEDRNAGSECESRHNSEVLNILYSEFQLECVNDIHEETFLWTSHILMKDW